MDDVDFGAKNNMMLRLELTEYSSSDSLVFICLSHDNNSTREEERESPKGTPNDYFVTPCSPKQVKRREVKLKQRNGVQLIVSLHQLFPRHDDSNARVGETH